MTCHDAGEEECVEGGECLWRQVVAEEGEVGCSSLVALETVVAAVM